MPRPGPKIATDQYIRDGQTDRRTDGRQPTCDNSSTVTKVRSAKN